MTALVVEEVEGVGSGSEDHLHQRLAPIQGRDCYQQARQARRRHPEHPELERLRTPSVSYRPSAGVRERIAGELGGVIADEGRDELTVIDMAGALDGLSKLLFWYLHPDLPKGERTGKLGRGARRRKADADHTTAWFRDR